MGSKRKRGAQPTAEEPSQKKTKVDQAPNHTVPKAVKEKLFADRSPFRYELEREDHERERLLYKLLASEDIDDRIDAAETIISSLLDGDGVSDGVLLRHLDRRLFRGLASGSDAARIGFSYVLTDVLGQLFGEKNLAATRYPKLTFDRVLGLLLEKTHAGGNIPGQEERDHFWGQLFGLKSFVQSGILFSDRTRWQAVLELLVKLSQKKVWLKSQAGFVIAQAIPQMSQEDVLATLEALAEQGLAKTPEGLGIWLAALDRYPDMKAPKPWKDPMASKALQEVAAVLKSSGKELAEEQGAAAAKAQQGNATAQLHFVWDMLLDRYIKRGKKREEKFKQFWDRAVDQGFFAKGSSDHQKLTGFKIFQKALRMCADRGFVMPGLFSQNLMVCLMNQASNATPRLHRAAVQVLKGVEKVTEEEPEILPEVLRQLLGGHGAYNFDDRVKGTEDGTRTVERILRFANSGNAEEIVNTLLNRALEAPDSEDDQKPLRIYGEYLFRLASRAGNADDAKSKGAVSAGALAFRKLAELAYPPADSSLSPNEKTLEVSRKNLMSAAAALLKRPEDFTYLCETILAIEPDTVAMSSEIKEQILPALERLRALVGKNKKLAETQARQGLAVLLAISILQLYHSPREDALDVLHDIEKCCDKLQDSKSGGASGVAEVLVEVLLSMLAESSHVTRQASLQVFEAFTPYMSAEALAYLTDILAAEENADGYKALFQEEGGEDDDEDDDEDDEDTDDVEEVTEENEAEKESESSDSDNDDESSQADSESESDSDTEGEAKAKAEKASFEEVLMKTFNISHLLDKDDEAESSDEEADMSDSEMLTLDDKLASHLKLIQAKTGKRKTREDSKKKVIEFKHRVLDLLDIFVKKEAASPGGLVFELLLPLVQLIKATREQSLSHKAVKIITEAQKLVKKGRSNTNTNTTTSPGASATAAIDVDEAVGKLEAIHEAAHDPSESKAFAAAVSAASLTVAGTLFAADRENYRRVADVYRRTQDRWVLGDLDVRTSLFTDWYNWCQSVRVAGRRVNEA